MWRHSYPCDPQSLSYEGGPAATSVIDEGYVFTFSKCGDLFCPGRVTIEDEGFTRFDKEANGRYRYLMVNDNQIIRVRKPLVQLASQPS